MNSLSPEAFLDPAVAHALAVRKAIQLENYHRFFVLYRDTPNLGIFIMDLMLDTRRLQALKTICRGYKPAVSVDFVVSELVFDSTEEGEEFLERAGCVLVQGGTEGGAGKEINTKDTVIDTAAVFTQDKLLM
jgi:hypothetical protein